MESKIFVDVGCDEIKGRRNAMEDVSVVEETHLPNLISEDGGRCLFMSVYDGHGSNKIANYVAAHFHKRLAEIQPTDDVPLDMETCLEETFMKFDNFLQEIWVEDGSIYRKDCGATALTCIISSREIHLAHAGDCRALVFSLDGTIIHETIDHKADLPSEKKRIYDAGSYVSNSTPARVGGMLAVSRAFGDYIFKSKLQVALKDQAVTAFPDVATISRCVESRVPKFVVLACDGIWDKLDSVAVTKLVLERFQQGQTAKQAATAVMLEAYRMESGDNLSCIVCYL